MHAIEWQTTTGQPRPQEPPVIKSAMIGGLEVEVERTSSGSIFAKVAGYVAGIRVVAVNYSTSDLVEAQEWAEDAARKLSNAGWAGIP